jgi:beta-glucosidase
LLTDILRERWGFQGYVVSDCWALKDFHENHHVTRTPAESAALGVKMGCDLNCGCTYEHIPAAVEQGLLTEADLEVCVARLFTARFRLGMFDPEERVPWASIPYAVNASPEHRELALQAARESIVLLKNDGTLPLRKDLGIIAVIGPNAADDQVLIGNYFGLPSQVTTPLEGIRAAVSAGTRVLYTDGCKLTGTKVDGLGRRANLSEARSVAGLADAVVLVLGLSAEIEGEQSDVSNAVGGGDKLDLNLTGMQQQLLEEITALGKPTVLVLIAGSAMNVSWAQDHVGAILDAWYPGETAGTAIAEVLFGDYNPGGRLPVTFPRNIEDVPPIEDYSMKGRTYRYAEAVPLYPFGYGLSFTRFGYSALELSATTIGTDDSVCIATQVTNLGEFAGDEVVQLYVRDLAASCVVPLHSLRGFTRLHLAAGASQRVEFTLTPRDLSLIDDAGRRIIEPGSFRLFVGGAQPDERSAELLGSRPLSVELELVGEQKELPY